MKTWFPLSLPCSEWGSLKDLNMCWMIKAASGITYKLRHSDNLHQSIPVSAHAQMSEQVKGSFFFKSIFTIFKCLYIIYSWNPDNLQIEALWKIWRAWIILNCSVHGSELIHFTSWRTLSILKHFNNSESKDVPVGIISYLNFDLSSPDTGQLRNRGSLHSEAFSIIRFHLQGCF